MLFSTVQLKTAIVFRVISLCALALGLMACGDLAVFLNQPQNIKISEGFRSIEVGEDGYFHITFGDLSSETDSGDYELYLLKANEWPASLDVADKSLKLSSDLLTVSRIPREDFLSLTDKGVKIADLKGLQSYTLNEAIDPNAHYLFSIKAKTNKVTARTRMISAKVNFLAPRLPRSGG